MIKPSRLKIGDTIGIVAPSSPIIGENIEELERAKKIIEEKGFKVKYSKNLFSNTNIYSATAREKAEDINTMFEDKDIKMIWCAKGGENCNTVFDYLNYDIIKKNPKILCGYSDITSLTNVVNKKTGLITFSGTNFKTIATDETSYSLEEVIKRFVSADTEIGKNDDEYITIQKGKCEGRLIGGNLSLIYGLTCGKYAINFKDKILFIEELGYESDPSLISNHLYFMKQNGVFNKIKGLWIGNYEHESNISLEKIIQDTIENDFNIPIIKSNNFGHIEKKTVIPIGTTARIDTSKKRKIQLIENCIKNR